MFNFFNYFLIIHFADTFAQFKFVPDYTIFEHVKSGFIPPAYNDEYDLLWCIILIPLCLFCFLFFKHFIFLTKNNFKSEKFYISFFLLVIILVFFYSVYIYYVFSLQGIRINIKCGFWFNFGFIKIRWGLLFDNISLTMICVVLFISILVQIYSFSYMENDAYITRFFSYLNLFTFFMLILVTSDNFLQLFLGWEGVGLCSYLLIGFWNTRLQAVKAALKAMVINRFGDIALLFAISLIFFFFRTLNFLSLSLLIYYIDTLLLGFSFSLLDLICVFLFFGAVGKSAQIGLHTWLPDAMEGPTPVSALIHAATMVTAGVFLLIRCSFFFEFSETVLIIVLFVGALTAFFSATIGLVQHDVKKIIAYSTCSQLGYMVVACGLSAYNVALYHLTTHACFKALLFLTAGSIIHALNDEQDIRKMGSLFYVLPISYVALLIGSIALIGFPFFAGYYSKDIILELLFVNTIFTGSIFYFLLVISAFFTIVYSCRIIFWVFYVKTNISRGLFKYISESSWVINFVLLILAYSSIFVGYFLFDLFVGFGTIFFAKEIFILPEHYLMINSEFLPQKIKLIPFFVGISGIVCCWFGYFIGIFYFYMIKIKLFKLYIFLIKKWYFDILFNYFLVKFFFKFGYFFTYLVLDKGFLEFFGPHGLTLIIETIIRRVLQKQKKQIIVQKLFSIFCFILFFFNCLIFI